MVILADELVNQDWRSNSGEKKKEKGPGEYGEDTKVI